MRVHLVDPAAYSPPYDHALAGALARAGATVELFTSHFPHGPVPVQHETGGSSGSPAGPPRTYEVREFFYGRASGAGARPRARRAIRAAEHLPDMLRYRREADRADVVHYQWLPILQLDRRLLVKRRPRVYTMHWRLPETGSRIGNALTRLLAEMDAVVVHTEHGVRRLQSDFEVPGEKMRLIPHGAFDYLTRQPEEAPLPDELRSVEAPVILAFGLVRPYKGTDVLLEAFQGVEGAELWIVGAPRMPMDQLHELAERAPGRVRFIDRFITDPEIPAFMRRADVVVLPYRNIEQSGVLYTALAFGRPMVLSAVGGFPEIAEQGAARLVPPQDPASLAETLRELLADEGAREALSTGAAQAAATRYSWDGIARATIDLYGDLLSRPADGRHR